MVVIPLDSSGLSVSEFRAAVSFNEESAPMILFVLTVTLAVLAAATDMRTRRIPNWLTVSALMLALAVRSFAPGEFAEGLAGAGIAFVVGLLLYMAGGFGAGDAKLIAAFGAILGSTQILGGLALSALAGGALAIYWSARTGRLGSLLSDAGRLVLYGITLGKRGQAPRLPGPSDANAMPFGVAISAGCVLVWLF